jgi:hypothetical protein
VAATAVFDGAYCIVTDKESLPTLRSRFLPMALGYGLADLDAGHGTRHRRGRPSHRQQPCRWTDCEG